MYYRDRKVVSAPPGQIDLERGMTFYMTSLNLLGVFFFFFVAGDLMGEMTFRKRRKKSSVRQKSSRGCPLMLLMWGDFV